MSIDASAPICRGAINAKGCESLELALALAEQLRVRPLVAHCHLGLGKVYGRDGRRDEAQKHLMTATTMYREMDMRPWLDDAEAEAGRQLRVL